MNKYLLLLLLLLAAVPAKAVTLAPAIKSRLCSGDLSAPTGSATQPWHIVSACPAAYPKWKVTNSPKKGDCVCYCDLYAPSGSAFQPWKCVAACPAGLHPVLTNSPNAGDKNCVP